MDQKLYDAARTGNVHILHELLQENDDNILEKVPALTRISKNALTHDSCVVWAFGICEETS